MKTEIRRTYKWGFALTEQDVRRIAQTCREHGEKLAAAPIFQTFMVRLGDGSVIETRDIDQVLALENTGKRRVEKPLFVRSGEAESASVGAWIAGIAA